MKFRECEELLRRRFSLRMKGMVYRTCVRSAMLYGSETWCLRESEMAVLRRTERAMMRLMCGIILVDRKNMDELMEMLGLKETLDRMAKANGVRWYEHLIRRDDDNILKKTMMLEVNGQRKRGRPECEESRVEDRGSCRSNEMEKGVRAIAEGMKCIRPPSAKRKNRIKTGYDDDDVDEYARELCFL